MSNATVLPHSIDAEQSLLGACLLNEACFHRVPAYLKPEHFFGEKHAELYRVISTMIQAGRHSAPASIRQFLPADFKVGEANFDDYMHELAMQATTILNIGEYALTIYELALRRDLIAVADEMRHNALNGDLFTDPFKQIETAEGHLARLKSGLNGSVSGTALQVTCVNDIEPEAIKWVWPGRLACGHVTLLSGAPGTGKSQKSCDVAARITTSAAWPDGGTLHLEVS